MNEYLSDLYKTHNMYAVEGFHNARQKVAEIFGDEGVELFDEFADSIDADEVFDLVDPEKTASEMGDEGLEQLADADALGRAIFHAMADEQSKHQKVAEVVEEALLSSFADELGLFDDEDYDDDDDDDYYY